MSCPLLIAKSWSYLEIPTQTYVSSLLVLRITKYLFTLLWALCHFASMVLFFIYDIPTTFTKVSILQMPQIIHE